MGVFSRSKGARNERNLVNALKDEGYPAERIPLSGSAGGSFLGDVKVTFDATPLLLEAKVRADGFKEIYGWLEAHVDCVVIKRDNCERVWCWPESKLFALLKEARGDA